MTSFPYWIPLSGVPCSDCGYPAAGVKVTPLGREVVHADARLPEPCTLANPPRRRPTEQGRAAA